MTNTGRMSMAWGRFMTAMQDAYARAGTEVNV
jgi:hypothetical protein